eukprot:SAG11_NODE_1299_length_5264_cov_5.517715_5_plen_398_part_00
MDDGCPPHAVDLDAVWDNMGSKLEFLLQSFTEGELSTRRPVIERPEWMRMYTDVYDICVNQDQDLVSSLYEKLRALIYSHLERQRESIKPHQGETLARNYYQRFKSVVQAVTYIKRIAEYMHRFWIPQQIYNGESDLVDVYHLNVLVLVAWKEVVLYKVDQILHVLLDLIDNGRRGNHADLEIVAGVIKSYVQVGEIDKDNPMKIYNECFEAEFLRRTSEFYRAEAQEFLRQNTVSDYMRKVEARFKEELSRAEQHLHAATKPKLLAICTETLVENWKETFFREFPGLMKRSRSDELSMMYRLLARTSAGLQSIAKSFQELILEEGRLLIDAKCQDIAADTKNVDHVKRGLPLVRDLTQVHVKYKQIVESCFANNHIFIKSLDQVLLLRKHFFSRQF